MAAEVVPYFLPQFFDNNGKPLAGGKVYTYKAGTTTPITTYKDASFTPNENPIILDSAGRASIYVGIQPVKFVICDADDNVIETRDHVSGASSTAVGIQTVVPIETDGVETEFDLGVDPELASNCTVVLVTSGGDRITFLTSEYTVSGTKIIFNSPPPAGTGEVRIGATRAIASSGLSDGSVSTLKLQDGAVTNAKLADNSVSTSKIQDEAIVDTKIADETIGVNHLKSDVPPRYANSLAVTSFSTENNNPTDVPNLSATIISRGKPIKATLIASAVDGGVVHVSLGLSWGCIGTVILARDTGSGYSTFRSIDLASFVPSLYGGITETASAGTPHTHVFQGAIIVGGTQLVLPASAFSFVDRNPPVGPVTYKIQLRTDGFCTIAVERVELFLEEVSL